MQNLYTVDSSLSENLALEAKIIEEHILAEQIKYPAKVFQQRIKDFNKEELEYIAVIILDAYSRQSNNSCFFELPLYLLDQRLKEYK